MKGEKKGVSSRRDCLKVMAVAAGGVAAGVGGASLVGRLGPASPGRWLVLTEEEACLVDLVTEQIIPSDQFAGASAAGVVNFIDQQLDGSYRNLLDGYRTGLKRIEKMSVEMFGRTFASLKWDEQTGLLQAMESGKVSKKIWAEQDSRRFFRMICDHTMQGFYGSPKHGGNKNYVSYRMMGLEYPRVIGQNRYPEI
ncbi:MAG: gluconate 2-dehydrogenase subunit 3 family protein [Kiritimatiellae bacterium]|jgi:gluconate 2-dehydrogenase gamma chain|nr:gluconate 2-dehydrogenase subunit 3 family protein [Kiritimatiellia bacterium]